MPLLDRVRHAADHVRRGGRPAGLAAQRAAPADRRQPPDLGARGAGVGVQDDAAARLLRVPVERAACRRAVGAAVGGHRAALPQRSPRGAPARGLDRGQLARGPVAALAAAARAAVPRVGAAARGRVRRLRARLHHPHRARPADAAAVAARLSHARALAPLALGDALLLQPAAAAGGRPEAAARAQLRLPRAARHAPAVGRAAGHAARQAQGARVARAVRVLLRRARLARVGRRAGAVRAVGLCAVRAAAADRHVCRRERDRVPAAPDGAARVRRPRRGADAPRPHPPARAAARRGLGLRATAAATDDAAAAAAAAIGCRARRDARSGSRGRRDGGGGGAGRGGGGRGGGTAGRPHGLADARAAGGRAAVGAADDVGAGRRRCGGAGS